MDSQIRDLKSYLATISPGKVNASDEIAQRLSRCWHELTGNEDGGMDGSKIYSSLFPYNRMEGVTWKPSLLKFQIERHGRTTGGSVYAEVQSWTVNLDTCTAELSEHAKVRQVRKKDQALKAEPIAHEILQLVLRRKKDERLKWSKDTNQVTLLLNKIIPAGNCRTRASRKERFWRAFEPKALEKGWGVSADQIRYSGKWIHIPARITFSSRQKTFQSGDAARAKV